MAKKVRKTMKKATVPKSVKKKSSGDDDPAAAEKSAVKETVKREAKRPIRKKVERTAGKTIADKSTDLNPDAIKTPVRRKSILSKAELSHFHDLLIEKLKEITGDVDHIESEALKKSRLDASGDLSSMPIHMADIGSDNYEQEFSLGLMDSERKIVHEIYEALKRIENGTYGICEGTGNPIPKSRLEGIPWTRYCVEYAQRIEKGLVVRTEYTYDSNEESADEDESEEGADEENRPDDDEDEEYVEEDKEEGEKENLFYGYEEEDDKDDTELA